jgi:UPF0176 protein
MNAAAPPILVVALYRFTPLRDLPELRATLARACAKAEIRGTLLLAPEGINGTIAGAEDGIRAVLAHIRTLPGCADLAVRTSRAAATPFHRLKVRIKREIVTMGEPLVDPAAAGRYVAPAEWNALIADPETLVIDTRNDYEVRLGSFAGAVDPATRHFRDFPAWARANRERLASAKTVAMFCTGGIRCEKATAFLKAEGVADVAHLQGGILAYLESVAPAESRWQGECFVFDERAAVGHGLVPGDAALCRACRMPVTPADRASEHFVEGVSCPACHAWRTEEQRAGYAERHRQARLAAARGEAHVGARYDASD